MLTFDADSHTYRLNGVTLPSVTTVIGGVWPELYEWCTEFARDRGSKVHQAIDEDLRGTLVDWMLDAEVEGYVMAARRVLADLDLKVELFEERLYSSVYGYAGTLDVVGRRRSGRLQGSRVLLDWKCGEPGWACGLQTAAYDAALQERHGIFVDERIGVRLFPDATYRITTYDDFDGDFADFTAALRVYRRKAA